MPLIKIDHIVSFSSEDPIHVANNILSSDNSKKWKCKTSGEKSAVVVLQLEKASVITGIDIGNEHSAYVEVLVSRSSTTDDYKVLLVMSSFMTPMESRQSQNINKVRMFTKEHLSQPECNEKWDRVKIYCTQPFNKHVQYGLSFINIHTSDSNLITTPVQMQIGKFIIRPQSPDNITSGSLFSKKKEEKEESLTGAAAIRAATSSQTLAKYGSPIGKPKLKIKDPPFTSLKQTKDVNESPKPRNRNELLYSKDEEEPNKKIDNLIMKKNKEIDKEKNIKNLENKTKKNNSHLTNTSNVKYEQHTNESINNPSTSRKVEQSNKEKQNELKRKNNDLEEIPIKKHRNNRITKSFNKLLEDVTLVISGIQNPDRGSLRTLALSMGAKYKPDWDNSCTHLICAFPNTPKFNQVKGKGKIIKRTWLEDCHSQRKKLSWRRYALDKSDKDKSESEDEIWETVTPSNSPIEETTSDSEINDINEHYENASDTEERLANIEKQHKRPHKQKEKIVNDIYSADTDFEDFPEEMPCSSSKKLIDIFDGRKFYINKNFQDEEYNKLKKYIVAYKGIFVDNPDEDSGIIIITNKDSRILKEMNSNLQCVSPNWIWECHNCQKLVPIDDYLF